MKTNYNGKLNLRLVMVASIMLVSFISFGQRVVPVDNGTILNDVINGDTTANGERVDLNTIYELKMNGIYPLTKELSIGAKLHIRSEGGSGFLPAIIPQKDDSGNYPKAINNAGDVYLEGIYLSNANGEDATPKWGGFRVSGEGSTVMLKDCQLEYDKASTIQIRADNIKIYIDGCIAAKTGNYKEYNGNGRLIDTRGFKTDSIVVTNSTIYYMQDRIIRNMGGEINYLEFDHVTVANNQGFHGCFAMARVHHAKITNNLVINGMYGGDHPNLNEQTSTYPDDNLKIYMITMDTIFEDSKLEISNNNFAFSQTTLDFFNSIDSISKPEVLAPSIRGFLGDAADNAYFEEAVEFTNMPDVPWDFLTSIYADPGALHPSNWPDEIGISNIDAGYSTSSVSATASTTDGPIGDPRWMETVGIFDSKYRSNSLEVSVYPNPVINEANFTIELKETSNVEVYVHDLTGKLVFTKKSQDLASGAQTIKLNTNDFVNGLYLYSVTANNKVAAGKITISK